MASLRKAVLAAIVKSFLRGKSLIQAIISYWISPLAFDETKKAYIGGSSSTTPAAVAAAAATALEKTAQDFLKEAEAELLGPISGDGLTRLSVALKKEFLERLESDAQCMLPSYSYKLPTGRESGHYLALDVGGSTLRVAVVELRGHHDGGSQSSSIVSMRNFFIGKSIKDLEGVAFFDWMAERIDETLHAGLQEDPRSEGPLSMALAWSFPIEQISLGSGKLQGMGKGFKANMGLENRDLGELLTNSCKSRGLNVQVEAIVNDSSACLLSQAFTHTTTRYGLILGTGFNLGAYLPVPLVGRAKFGDRPSEWFDKASHVIVNTELSMFGKGSLPLTRWDLQLRDGLPRPDFQPLEYLVSGMYLGEIARFALVEAIEATGIFGGVVPPSLTTPYALSTETMSDIEKDTSDNLIQSIKLFSDRHPSTHTPTTSDVSFLRSLASFISIRSSALVAVAVYSLGDVCLDSHKEYAATLPESSLLRQAAEAHLALNETVIAFNGSVIENYPNYLGNCQRYIDDLVSGNDSPAVSAIKLVPAKESSLMGAAVASACARADL